MKVDKALQTILADTTFQITDKNKIYLQEIINKYPHLLKDIDDAMEKIMQDGKIDIFDVPQIILVICTVSQNIMQAFKGLGVLEDGASLAGTIVQAIFFKKDENQDDDDDDEDEEKHNQDITNMQKIVNSSFSLIHTNLEHKHASKWSCCWCK